MEPAAAVSGTPRGIAWRIFLTCWLVYLLFLNPAGNLMSNAILGASVSLAERQNWQVQLAVPQEAPDVAVVIRRGPFGMPVSSVYSGVPPGASLAAVPCYTVAWWLTRLLPVAWAREHPVALDATILHNVSQHVPAEFRFHTPPIIYWFQLVAAALVSTTAAAGTVVLCYLLLSRLGAALWQRLTVCFTLAFGTTLFPHALAYSKDVLATFLAFAAFTLIDLSPDARPARDRWVLPAGYLAGAAVATSYHAAVVVLFLIVYARHKYGWTGVRSLGLGLALPVGLLALYHTILFGAPWTTPYHFSILGPFAGHQEGFVGLTGLHGPALWGLSFSPFQGVFIYHPFLLVVLAGALLRRRPALTDEVALSLAVLTGLLLAAASSQHLGTWSGGFLGWGPRRFVLATPFIALLLAGYLARTRSAFARGLVLLLVVVSVGPQLLGAAWGGTLFPDQRAVTLLFAKNPEVLRMNPIAVMWQAVQAHGFSAPLLRVYCASDAAAALWTTVIGLIIAWTCWCLWAPCFRRRPRATPPTFAPANGP